MKDKFIESIQTARRQFIVFSIGTMLISLIAIPALGLFLYAMVIYILAFWRIPEMPSPLVFWIVYPIVFVAMGLLYHSRKHSASIADQIEKKIAGDDSGSPLPWPWSKSWTVMMLHYLFAVLFYIPGFVMSLMIQFVGIKHLSVSVEVQDRAYDLISEFKDQRGIPGESLVGAMERDNKTTVAALRLLQELGFVRFNKQPGGEPFLVTDKCRDVLDVVD